MNITISIKESSEELTKLLRKSRSTVCRDRLRCLLLIKDKGFDCCSLISNKLGRNKQTISRWIKRYNLEGISFIHPKSGGNNTRSLTPDMVLFLASKVTDPSTTITSYVELVEMLNTTFKVSIPYTTVRDHCIVKHGTKLKVSRKKHYKQCKIAVSNFKKT